MGQYISLKTAEEAYVAFIADWILCSLCGSVLPCLKPPTASIIACTV